MVLNQAAPLCSSGLVLDFETVADGSSTLASILGLNFCLRSHTERLRSERRGLGFWCRAPAIAY